MIFEQNQIVEYCGKIYTIILPIFYGNSYGVCLNSQFCGWNPNKNEKDFFKALKKCGFSKNQNINYVADSARVLIEKQLILSSILLNINKSEVIFQLKFEKSKDDWSIICSHKNQSRVYNSILSGKLIERLNLVKVESDDFIVNSIVAKNKPTDINLSKITENFLQKINC